MFYSIIYLSGTRGSFILDHYLGNYWLKQGVKFFILVGTEYNGDININVKSSE